MTTIVIVRKNNDVVVASDGQVSMGNTVIKKTDKSKVTVGPAESMSKSKKNTVDPEKMIEADPEMFWKQK